MYEYVTRTIIVIERIREKFTRIERKSIVCPDISKNQTSPQGDDKSGNHCWKRSKKPY
ncbi:MAG: hypothetical protein N2513_03255 [Deltaproteobacteria bacterium]|nr:hypothetical protein [Deltaproteobacteria bacterium]